MITPREGKCIGVFSDSVEKHTGELGSEGKSASGQIHRVMCLIERTIDRNVQSLCCHSIRWKTGGHRWKKTPQTTRRSSRCTKITRWSIPQQVQNRPRHRHLRVALGQVKRQRPNAWTRHLGIQHLALARVAWPPRRSFTGAACSQTPATSYSDAGTDVHVRPNDSDRSSKGVAFLCLLRRICGLQSGLYTVRVRVAPTGRTLRVLQHTSGLRCSIAVPGIYKLRV